MEGPPHGEVDDLRPLRAVGHHFAVDGEAPLPADKGVEHEVGPGVARFRGLDAAAPADLLRPLPLHRGLDEEGAPVQSLQPRLPQSSGHQEEEGVFAEVERVEFLGGQQLAVQGHDRVQLLAQQLPPQGGGVVAFQHGGLFRVLQGIGLHLLPGHGEDHLPVEAADAQGAGPGPHPAEDVLHAHAEVVIFKVQPGIELPAFLRQLHAPVGAAEEGAAEVLFDAFDGLAQGGLADVQLRRRPGEVLMSRGAEEDLDLPHIDACHFSSSFLI